MVRGKTFGLHNAAARNGKSGKRELRNQCLAQAWFVQFGSYRANVGQPGLQAVSCNLHWVRAASIWVCSRHLSRHMKACTWVWSTQWSRAGSLSGYRFPQCSTARTLLASQFFASFQLLQVRTRKVDACLPVHASAQLWATLRQRIFAFWMASRNMAKRSL